MVDATDSKSVERKLVWVQVPLPVLCDVARHRKHLNLRFGCFLVSFVLWLVVAAGVKS